MTVTAAAALFVGAAACSSTDTPSVPSLPSNLPNTGSLAANLKDQLGSLATGSGALAALGQLGQQQGASEQVKSLAAKLVSNNQELTDKLRQAGAAAGVTLPDPNTPELQKTLDDLKQKSGPDFDQSWLESVQASQQNAQSAVDGLASAPGVPAQVAQAAQDARDHLAADQAQAKQAAEAVAAASGGNGQDAAGAAGGEAAGSAGTPGAAGSGAADTGPAGTPQAGKPYTVQRGDTLSSIAQRAYGNPQDEKKIAAANHLPHHNVITPGQVLTLP